MGIRYQTFIVVRLVGVFRGSEGIQTFACIQLPVLYSGHVSQHSRMIHCLLRMLLSQKSRRGVSFPGCHSQHLLRRHHEAVIIILLKYCDRVKWRQTRTFCISSKTCCEKNQFRPYFQFRQYHTEQQQYSQHNISTQLSTQVQSGDFCPSILLYANLEMFCAVIYVGVHFRESIIIIARGQDNQKEWG